jgi:hypothetical protein
MRLTRDLARIVLAALMCGCAASPPRDTVPVAQEERRSEPTETTYEHIARRPHATVALAEARGLDKAEAVGATEAIADRLEDCSRAGAGAGGAVRVVARVGDDGTIDGLNVKVEPGHEATALRCVIAPIKLLVFKAPGPAAKRPDGTVSRGLAIEAQW